MTCGLQDISITTELQVDIRLTVPSQKISCKALNDSPTIYRWYSAESFNTCPSCCLIWPAPELKVDRECVHDVNNLEDNEILLLLQWARAQGTWERHTLFLSLLRIRLLMFPYSMFSLLNLAYTEARNRTVLIFWSVKGTPYLWSNSESDIPSMTCTWEWPSSWTSVWNLSPLKTYGQFFSIVHAFRCYGTTSLERSFAKKLITLPYLFNGVDIWGIKILLQSA